jgi:hypothetical protein
LRITCAAPLPAARAPEPWRVALLALVLLAGGRDARAADYGADIRIESEADLYELYDRGVISEDALQALLELLRTGVDVNSANREQLAVCCRG